MRTGRRLLAAAVAGTTTIGLALAGAALVSPAATAAGPVLSETDYLLQGTGYGTRVTSPLLGVDSTRTAFSYLGCTRLAGIQKQESLAGVTLPPGDDGSALVTVDSVVSRTRTYKAPTRDIAAAAEGSNTIGSVRLGASGGPQLVIEGLTTTSTAWATKKGALKTRNVVSGADFRLVNAPAGVPEPLLELIEAPTALIGQLVKELMKTGPLEIPGLGRVTFGYDRHVRQTRAAFASSFVLQVLLYGADGRLGGTGAAADSLVGIGRSWAKISRKTPGIMSGVGFGANLSLLQDVVSVGRLGEQPLDCKGTGGKVVSGPTVGVGPEGAPFDLALLGGRSYGTFDRRGGSRAWTEGSVADFTLGPLTIKGVVGRVNVAQDRRGRITRRDFAGSSIGEILLDGTSLGSLGVGEVAQLPTDQLPPQIAKIEFFKRERWARGGSISAVVITLADGTPGVSVLRLGNAQTKLRRY